VSQQNSAGQEQASGQLSRIRAQELASGQLEEKQRANIYTMLLILSFIALCVACTLLWMELQDYGPFPWYKTEGVAPATSWLPMPTGNGWSALEPFTWLRA
jgi:hypothetical protein